MPLYLIIIVIVSSFILLILMLFILWMLKAQVSTIKDIKERIKSRKNDNNRAIRK